MMVRSDGVVIERIKRDIKKLLVHLYFVCFY